jgi:hypothetical protein
MLIQPLDRVGVLMMDIGFNPKCSKMIVHAMCEMHDEENWLQTQVDPTTDPKFGCHPFAGQGYQLAATFFSIQTGNQLICGPSSRPQDTIGLSPHLEEGWRRLPPQVAQRKNQVKQTKTICLAKLMSCLLFASDEVSWFPLRHPHSGPLGASKVALQTGAPDSKRKIRQFGKRPLPVFSKQCQAASLEARSRFRHATRKRKWPRATRGGRGNMAG